MHLQRGVELLPVGGDLASGEPIVKPAHHGRVLSLSKRVNTTGSGIEYSTSAIVDSDA